MLEKELPEMFNYKIDRFKVLEESKHEHESKFEAEFSVNICDEEKSESFVHKVELALMFFSNKTQGKRDGLEEHSSVTGMSKSRLVECPKTHKEKVLEVVLLKVWKGKLARTMTAKPH